MVKNVKYGALGAPERASFKGRVESNSPHPPLEGQSKESGAFCVVSFRCAVMIRFFKVIMCSGLLRYRIATSTVPYFTGTVPNGSVRSSPYGTVWRY
jgi:hypothetical protein